MCAARIDGFAGAFSKRLTLGRRFGNWDEVSVLMPALATRLSVRPLILCFTLPPGGGGMALLAFRSLWLVSSNVLPVCVGPMAGSLEGGLSPLGRTFSSCDGGRSMSLAPVVLMPHGSIRPRSTQLQFLAMSTAGGGEETKPLPSRCILANEARRRCC